MDFKRRVCAVAMLVGGLTPSSSAAPDPSREIDNLRAFAKLYGYVRFFHPSDEAAALDWDRFAIYGSRSVRSASDEAALAQRLRELFRPIAPTVRIYNPLTDTVTPSLLIPESTAGLETVAWQHKGVGLGAGSIYRSKRTRNRPPESEGLLFEAAPRVGEIADKSLGGGLRARIPLALYSVDGATFPRGDAQALSELSRALEAVNPAELTAADPALRFGGVVIAWNVFQHFYPYFDVVDTDWDAVLTTTLVDAADDDEEAFLDTLRRMVAGLHDGHGGVRLEGSESEKGLPPFETAWVDEKVVVTAVADTDEVRVGDVVLEVDGVPAADLLEARLQTASGTLRWKRVRALWRLVAGPPGSTATVRLERDGETLDVQVERNRTSRLEKNGPSIEKLRPGIYYVDLTRADSAAIQERIDELAAADGVVFDLRGYPNANHNVLAHLTDEALRSAIWNVPQILYPDRERIDGWDRSGRWTIAPHAPRFRGKVAFMTDARAISYAESVLGIVEHYRLGEIVGQPTAGANGNVNPFVLPGGYRVTWTGMKVLKHDGSQHHLVGIRPTIPVEPTLAGIRAGRDEVLEAALRAVAPAE